MNLNFPLILVVLSFVTLILWLIGFFVYKTKKQPLPKFFIECKSYFYILFAVLVIRSFLVQPFRVPTGSLEPSILTNEFIFVNQFAYGLRLPVLHTKIISFGEPERGDIAVFRFPGNPKIDYIKRVIGLPGDHIIYKNRELTINGKTILQKFLNDTIDDGENGVPVKVMEENLNGVKHKIYLHKNIAFNGTFDLVVPKNMYFMMGDNRDGSLDSRYWGFVPEKNLVGKAFFVWLSWNSNKHWFRLHRFGTIL